MTNKQKIEKIPVIVDGKEIEVEWVNWILNLISEWVHKTLNECYREFWIPENIVILDIEEQKTNDENIITQYKLVWHIKENQKKFNLIDIKFVEDKDNENVTISILENKEECKKMKELLEEYSNNQDDEEEKTN